MTPEERKERYRGKVGAQMRQDDALALWVKGMTYEEVAKELGYANRSGAYHAVTAALDRFNTAAEERASHGRAIALARIMPLWRKAAANALSVDGGAKDLLAAAQIWDRLSRLEGVRDPAQEIRVTYETQLDRELAELAAKLAAATGDSGMPISADRQ